MPAVRITEITRRKLLDALSLENVHWAGQMEEADFLGRIYDLAALPSEDPRFPNAAGDIWQHRVRNYDWPDDWVFTDSRFELMHGADSILLRFLAEMLHPVVRSDEEEVAKLASTFNEALRRDGYELYVAEWISGHGVYGWRRMDSFHGSTPDLGLTSRPLTDPQVLQDHLDRIRKDLTSDPAAAINSCKNLVESLFKVILERSGVEYGVKDDIPKLYRKVSVLLELNTEAVDGSARGSEASTRILGSLVTAVQGMAELRNALGTGHGQSTRSKALARHARLALNAAVAISEFVLDTWQARIDKGRITLIN